MLRRITHFQPFAGANHKNPQQEIVNFKDGQIIKGIVLKKLPGREILVSAGGKQFRAFTGLKLEEGSKHHFQVNRLGSKIELKLLDILNAKLGLNIRSLSSNSASRNNFTGILAHLSNPHNFTALSEKMTKAVNNLRRYLNSFIYSNPDGKNKIWVARGILGSGLFWENKILQYLLSKKTGSWKKLISSDLKGLLLSMDKGIKGEIQDRDDVNPLAQKIKQALNIIEQDQLLNLSSVNDGLGWLLNIPCPGAGVFNRAEIFINKKDKGISFTIYLELTQLGRLEMKVSIIESLIGINIFAEDSEKAAFINDNIYMLEKTLQNSGMSTGMIRCEVKEIKGVIDSDLLHKGMDDEPSMHLVI